MKATGKTVIEILTSLPDDRVEPFNKLHDVIVKNLPKGFEPAISYGGLGYVVPHSINFYHMGIYTDQKLLKWFVREYPKHSRQKLDMGKSCVRFKKLDEIPYKLIGELMRKVSVDEWINIYEKNIKK